MTVAVSEKMNAFLSTLHVPQNPVQQNMVEELSSLNFPTTKNEYWKYTRLGKIANAQFTNQFESLPKLAVEEYLVSTHFIIIENGRPRLDLSSLSTDFDVQFHNADELETNLKPIQINHNTPVFDALNSCLFEQAISIAIAPHKINTEPLQLVFVNHGENIHAANRIRIKSGKLSVSEIVITEISLKAASCFGNTFAEITVEEGATLTLNKIQAENNSSLHISTENVTQAQNTTFRINTFTLSGLLVRNNLNIEVVGENCQTFMNGAVIATENQHVDNHTFVNHKVPHCYSNENYKYVLDEQSTGVFNGRVIVQPNAQVINAYQNNANLLLSDKASINSKPELEIYADDVKCSHGSTTGQLDEAALFYLQTRGISNQNARKILVSAFVGEVVNAVDNEKVSALIHKLLLEKFGWDF